MWDNMDSYPEWLEMVTKNADVETYNQGWVLTDTFFAMRQSDKKNYRNYRFSSFIK